MKMNTSRTKNVHFNDNSTCLASRKICQRVIFL